MNDEENIRQKVYVPISSQIEKGLEVAGSGTSIEPADYLYANLVKTVTQSGLVGKPEVQDMLARVRDNIDYIKFKIESKTQPWFAQTGPDTSLKIFHENLANHVAQVFRQLGIKNVRFDFALNALCEYVRAFSSDGKALASVAVEQLDKLFNAWLITDLESVSKSGRILKADTQGKVLDEQGSLEENAQNVIQRIKDDFANSMQEKGISVDVHQQNYPAKTQEQPVQKTGAPAAQAPVEPAQKAEAEPQAPRTNV